MTSIHYNKSSQNILTLTFDEPHSSTNVMNRNFRKSLDEVAHRIKAETSLAGIILASAKTSFFAGGDLHELSQVTDENKAEFYNNIESLKAAMRTIETCKVPVVACIGGSALGGGWELALTAHHRIAVNNNAKLGLPEVTFGLIPGAGGVSKMVRLLGLEAALPFLLEGIELSPAEAHKLGLIHSLVSSSVELLPQAVRWIESINSQGVPSQQPWDVKGYKIPGGTAQSPSLMPKIMMAPAMVSAKTKGCYPATRDILACAVEGTLVDFDTALRIESRYLTKLALSQVAKNLIGTMFFQLNAIKKGEGRPQNSTTPFTKIGVIGAGMMGSGIALAAAWSGFPVILKDQSATQTEAAITQARTSLNKRVESKKMTSEACSTILERIKPTGSAQDFSGCDLVIEAVFENRELKATVTREAGEFMTGSGVFASNTSTLPITSLAKAYKKPENFIGLHFFSPVAKMPLVEIIRGKQTSDETLSRCIDFVRQLKKIPIVVQDSRGFFTSRVFATYLDEGFALLDEGVKAALVEQAAVLAGMPVGPLAVADEVSLSLIDSIHKQTALDLGTREDHPENHSRGSLITRMLEQGRLGKASGKGFYEYPPSGEKFIWPLIRNITRKSQTEISVQDVKDRLLYIQALETVRCLDEGVLTSVASANCGSIFGIGFPPWTGGCLQFINQVGLKPFVERSTQLAAIYGRRFEPTRSLIKRAELGEVF